MTDCEKYKMFVEDNHMMAFIIWEQTILPNDMEYQKTQNGDNTTDIADIDFDILS